jgi:hypothetical protein
MKSMLGIYRIAHKSVNREHSLVLTGMSRFKPLITGKSQLHDLFQIHLLSFSIATIFVNSISNEEIYTVF